jgi:hypothetical protein
MTKRNVPLFLIFFLLLAIAFGLAFFAQLLVDWFLWLKDGGVRELPLRPLTNETSQGNSQDE